MKKNDEAFTKIARKILTDVRDLVDWGVDRGLTTPEQLRLTVAARREVAVKLIESGMSQRQAAKQLGVSHSTVQSDLAGNLPNGGKKSATPEPEPEDEPAAPLAAFNREAANMEFRSLRSSAAKIEELIKHTPGLADHADVVAFEVKLDAALIALDQLKASLAKHGKRTMILRIVEE